MLSCLPSAAGHRQAMNQAELGCWSAIRCQFSLTHCIHNDLRGNADLKSALRNAWLVPGQDSAGTELPWGDSEGQWAPLTQQEKQSHFKSLWHLVPRPGIFIMCSFPTTAQLGGDAECGLIGADRCISGHVSLLHVLQEQVRIIMTWTNDWAMNIEGLVIQPIRENGLWNSYIMLLFSHKRNSVLCRWCQIRTNIKGSFWFITSWAFFFWFYPWFLLVIITLQPPS